MLKTIKNYLKKNWGWGGYGDGAAPYTFLLSTMNTWGPFGSGVNTPWKYDMYSWLGYMSNPIVNRCVTMISNAVAGIPWKLYRKTADGKDVHIDKHPVLDLLRNPNPLLSENDFFSNYVKYLQISGNVYVYRVGPNHGAPKELYFLRPDRILILNATEGLGGSRDVFEGEPPIYEYTCGSQRAPLDLKLLHHGKLFNPLNDYYGLSPMQAAATSIDQNNEALLWNVNLLRNAASPTGIMSTENNLGDEQIYRLKEQMNQKYQGGYNAGRPMLLEGGLKWEKVGMTPTEMAWMDGMKQSSKNIALTFGIDPSLMGDGEHKSFNTFNDAQRAFYTETVIPLCDKIRDDFLNRWLLPLFPRSDQLYFQYDLEACEAMNEDRTIVWERVLKGVEAGIITQDEAREAIGYEALEAAYEQDNPLDTDVMNEEINDSAKKKVRFKTFNLTTQLEKEAYINAVEKLRTKWDRIIQKRVHQQFIRERDSVLSALKNIPANVAEKYALQAVDEMDWRNLYHHIYQDVMKEFSKKTLQSYKYYVRRETKQYDISAFTSKFIQETTEERSEDVKETTKKRIKNLIIASLIAGFTIDMIKEKIRDLYDHDIPIRSRAIAQTEVITAGNAGTRFAAKSVDEVLNKQWVAIHDDKTRESHRSIDGEIRKMDIPYSNGLMFPGDPNGSSAETINCRCVEIYLT